MSLETTATPNEYEEKNLFGNLINIYLNYSRRF